MHELPLLDPSQCALVLVDEQAGLAFAAGSSDPQMLRNNGVATAKTAVAFGVPIVASTSASKVYSGPLMPAFRAVLPDVTPMERRSMNLWEDDAVPVGQDDAASPSQDTSGARGTRRNFRSKAGIGSWPGQSTLPSAAVAAIALTDPLHGARPSAPAGAAQSSPGNT
jgi:hypothetical protein